MRKDVSKFASRRNLNKCITFRKKNYSARFRVYLNKISLTKKKCQNYRLRGCRILKFFPHEAFVV